MLSLPQVLPDHHQPQLLGHGLSLLFLLVNKGWFVPKPFRQHGVVLKLWDGGIDEVWVLSTPSLAFFSFKSPD